MLSGLRSVLENLLEYGNCFEREPVLEEKLRDHRIVFASLRDATCLHIDVTQLEPRPSIVRIDCERRHQWRDCSAPNHRGGGRRNYLVGHPSLLPDVTRQDLG